MFTEWIHYFGHLCISPPDGRMLVLIVIKHNLWLYSISKLVESGYSLLIHMHHFLIFMAYIVVSSSSVFCPRARPPLQTQAPRLQFCPKAGLPLQTQEPRLQFYYRWIGTVVFRCFPHPTLSLASEKILKDLIWSQEHQRGGEGSGFG